MLFNRRRIKLSAEEKSFYDDKLVQIQQIFSLGTVVEENEADSNKGKYIETSASDSDVEMKKLCEASIRRAAEIASGYGDKNNKRTIFLLCCYWTILLSIKSSSFWLI